MERKIVFFESPLLIHWKIISVLSLLLSSLTITVLLVQNQQNIQSRAEKSINITKENNLADAGIPPDLPSIIPDQYIVVLNPGYSPQGEAESARQNEGVQILQVYEYALSGFAFKGSSQAADALKKNPRVKLVSQDHTVRIVQSNQTLPTGINRIDVDTNPTANINNVDDRVNVNVAIIDTGIDALHIDLHVVGGKDCMNIGSYNDNNGHGTHVAGSAAALDNTTGVVGVAPGANLWSVKVLDANGYGSWSQVICGIDFVTLTRTDTNTTNDIAVANMSLGGFGADDNNCGNTDGDVMHQAICNSVTKGVVYVVAAGNSGSDATNYIPAAYDEVITVSAINDTDGQPGGLGPTSYAGPDDQKASYSNFGQDVDIAAPGTSIFSTYLGSDPASKTYYYSTLSGTSMASPHVTGAVALYVANYGIATNTNEVATIRQNISDPTRGYSVAQNDPRGFTGDVDTYPEPFVYVGSSGATPYPTLSITPSPTSTPTPTLLPTVTITPSPSPTPTPTFDSTLPTVKITSPTDGGNITRNAILTIQASASDNVGVAKVEFTTSASSSILCTDTSAPYTCSWKVPAKPRVIYKITAKAYDAANNTGTHTIQVTAR